MIKILALLAALWAGAAHAQSVQQSGSVTPGHVAQWAATGVVKDGGTAANGSLTSVGITNNGTGLCQNSAIVTSAGYQQICLGTTTSGGGFLSVQNYGSAIAQGLTFNINGTPISVPTGGGTFPTLNLPLTDNELICADGTSGVLKGCFNTVPVSAGGTGATTATAARSNLGLGTIATQDASAVAITGGTILGLANPAVASEAANKAYVDAVATGLSVHTPVRLATAAILPNSPTYSNGASGVGATLTAGSNTTLTVDGSVANLNDRVLVKNQVTAANNGVYTVTTAGDGSNAWVLTRATDFDTSAEMLAGSYFLVTAGSTNIGAAYTLQTTVATVGSTAVTFIQFSQAVAGVTSIQSVTGPITLGGSLSMAGSVLSDTVRTRLTGATTFYVRSDGNNNCVGTTNAGGSSGACAWADWQFALTKLNTSYDLAGFVANIVAGETGVVTWVPPSGLGYQCTGPFTGSTGPASVVMSGTTNNSFQNTIIDSSPNGAGQPAIQILNGCQITLQDFVLKSTLNTVACIGGGYLQYANLRWNGATNVDIYATRHCQVEMVGVEVVQAIAGNNHIQASHHGEWRNAGQTIFYTVSGAYGTISNSFAYAEGLGTIVFTGGANFNLLGNVITGQQCYAEGNGVIQFAGQGTSFLPGTANSCTTTTGGQVID